MIRQTWALNETHIVDGRVAVVVVDDLYHF